MCYFLESGVDPRGAAISAFISDTTQFETQMYVEISYCFSQCQAPRKRENLTVTVVHIWETPYLPPGHVTGGTQRGCCPALSLTQSLDLTQELQRRDGEGCPAQQHLISFCMTLPSLPGLGPLGINTTADCFCWVVWLWPPSFEGCPPLCCL